MTESNFIDYIKIYARSGNGGAGSAHLRREKFVTKGGPDGGDGGRGGHIVIKGNKNMWTLHHLRFLRHSKAGSGENGGKSRSTGKNGSDTYIEVPLGTMVRCAETKAFLFEITEHLQEKILLKGGKGGLGNWHFRSATNQTPRYAQPGRPAQEGFFLIELKILADVGLVGFPNAGKSTLLASITRAKPKIAAYAFTTLKPNLGIVPYKDFYSFVMADIPGIIQGASEGKGLGHRFLRHIERNAVLLFLIPADSDDIPGEYKILLNELKQYSPELLDKKRFLAISKSDLLDEELKTALKNELQQKLSSDLEFLFISAVTQTGLKNLKEQLWRLLQ